MIDDELRRTFAEREVSVPSVALVAERITAGIARRHRRTRVVGLTAVVLAATLATAVAPVAVSRWWDVDATPAESSGPATPDRSVATTPPARLAPVPAITVTMPVRPGWLPGAVATPRQLYAAADVRDGSRWVTYYGAPRTTAGVESVALLTRAAPSASDHAPIDKKTLAITDRDTRQVDVRGHRATQHVETSSTTGVRFCRLAWQERANLWVLVMVVEKAWDHTTTCVVGHRVARELHAEPLEIARPVRFGLVPRGYTLVNTGTNEEEWCPTSGGERHEHCLSVRDGNGQPARNPGVRVSVRGRDAWLDRTPDGADLLVPRLFRIFAPSGGARLSDQELIRIAEAIVLPRPW